MTHYQVVIAEERRLDSRLASPINNDLRVDTGRKDANGFPIYNVTPRPAQLHSLGERIDNLAQDNILYAAAWEPNAPFITPMKGDIADLKMFYLGWPMVSEKEWLASQPPSLPFP